MPVSLRVKQMKRPFIFRLILPNFGLQREQKFHRSQTAHFWPMKFSARLITHARKNWDLFTKFDAAHLYLWEQFLTRGERTRSARRVINHHQLLRAPCNLWK